MKVLLACEESQSECKAFRAVGCEAYSCDIQDCSGGHPEWHIKDDALYIAKQYDWDLLIAHPPCTYLSKSGHYLLLSDRERYEKMLAAREFFLSFLHLTIPHICVENPVPSPLCDLPPYSQLVNPFEFGDPYMKRTCYWLINLVPLQPTKYVIPEYSWTLKHSSPKIRSKSFDGISCAMALQWSSPYRNGLWGCFDGC